MCGKGHSALFQHNRLTERVSLKGQRRDNAAVMVADRNVRRRTWSLREQWESVQRGPPSVALCQRRVGLDAALCGTFPALMIIAALQVTDATRLISSVTPRAPKTIAKQSFSPWLPGYNGVLSVQNLPLSPQKPKGGNRLLLPSDLECTADFTYSNLLNPANEESDGLEGFLQS